MDAPARDARPKSAIEGFASLWARASAPPSVFEYLQSHESLTPAEVFGLVLLDLRQRWERGCPVPIERYLAEIPVLADVPDARRQLALTEFRTALALGKNPQYTDYVSRYPDLASNLRDIVDQVAYPRTVDSSPQGFEGHQTQESNSAASPLPLDGRGEPASSEADLATLASAAALANAPAPIVKLGEAPATIGRYRIVRVLGEGGFGRVYLAHDDDLDRAVAIKVPHRARLATPKDADAYLAEARVLASLDHPGIVPVYDVGRTHDHLCYVVSKWIEGNDLASKLAQERFGYLAATELVAAVAEALHFAHRRGLVHRDIKPANILLDTAGRPFLADFGLALKEEDFGKGSGYAGTPAYMSAEQARGEGHRVDGRSDIFSLGVVFYELLTGRRPFRGDTQRELLNQIATLDPRPPRQIDDAIPKELERICLKALAKRASDRYTTASDMAEDLRYFLTHYSSLEKSRPQAEGPALKSLANSAFLPVSVSATGTTGTESSQQLLSIVPKGLRSFDANDADFFLELLPGPRDRDHLPASIQFWKSKLEERDPARTFAVGLLYGPSGCGKSSLVKAGLLPRLASHVVSLYVEATADDTEARLMKSLRRLCPEWSSDQTLTEGLASIRRHQGLSSGRKLVIVVDQFEQWLFTHREETNSELARAFRQCDGEWLQVVLMVRDDFWMPATRFMAELEQRLLEGENTAAVDLFDLTHATKVLAAFGRAFGALPEHSNELSRDQRAFLKQAVGGLAQDGLVVPVRLALFAEMVKSKPWTPATLRAVGGAEGVGVAFLEETFSSRSAHPAHRHYQKGAQAVLKSLLPQQGGDIKGHMQSREALLQASGYAGRPADFESLLAILDTELRLITPTTPEGSSNETSSDLGESERYYQLTHDYLVPSLRKWLTRKQRETRRGRAALRLEDRAGLWESRPEPRYLPGMFEWLSLRLWTRRRDWTATQTQMMKLAGRRHALIAGVMMMGMVAAGWVAREQTGALKAAALVDALMAAETGEVPPLVRQLSKYRRWADDRLRRTLHDADAEPRQKLHASLALLPVDASPCSDLIEALLRATPAEFTVVRDALINHQAEVVPRLWEAWSRTDASRDRRFRAACALAAYAPGDPRWKEIAPAVAAFLVAENSLHVNHWVHALQSVREVLIPPLADIFRRAGHEPSERMLATNILADFAAGHPAQLADLIMDAEPRQFTFLFPSLAGESAALPVLEAELKQPPPSETDPETWERAAKRQANAGIALLRLDRPQAVWSHFRHSDNPRVRSYLIHRCAQLEVDPQVLADRLWSLTSDETALPAAARFEFEAMQHLFDGEASLQRALLLALGEYSRSAIPAPLRAAIVPRVAEWYLRHPDAGVHAAAGWLLQRWGATDVLDSLQPRLPHQASRGDRQWFVNSQGQLFVVIPGPVEFHREMPPEVVGPFAPARLEATYAIAAHEVTVEQLQRALPDFEHTQQARTPSTRCPMPRVTWFEAAAYCNWLSAQEGLPPSQWCYQPNAQGKYAEGMTIPADALHRLGYRLPTNDEWEFACRAGAATSRHYGVAEELLPKYAWYLPTAHDRLWPVGLLKPNDWGLFDTLGNVVEWCHDVAGPVANPRPRSGKDLVIGVREMCEFRGGAISFPASNVRTAYRGTYPAAVRNYNIGFRIARTLR